MPEIVCRLSEGSERNLVELTCIKIGTDLQVMITGGAEHIGAVAAGVPYKKDKIKSNASVISIKGHQEDELCWKIARLLSNALAQTVIVTAGIHYDNMTGREINKVLDNVNLLAHRLIEFIKSQ